MCDCTILYCEVNRLCHFCLAHTWICYWDSLLACVMFNCGIPCTGFFILPTKTIKMNYHWPLTMAMEINWSDVVVAYPSNIVWCRHIVVPRLVICLRRHKTTSELWNATDEANLSDEVCNSFRLQNYQRRSLCIIGKVWKSTKKRNKWQRACTVPYWTRCV